VCRAAGKTGHDPDRGRFIRTVRLVRGQIDDPAALPPNSLAAITVAAFAEMLERLNPQRRQRTCPASSNASAITP
jgi:hypothetical protein